MQQYIKQNLSWKFDVMHPFYILKETAAFNILQLSSEAIIKHPFIRYALLIHLNHELINAIFQVKNQISQLSCPTKDGSITIYSAYIFSKQCNLLEYGRQP